MQQLVVRQHQRHHRRDHRRAADADAGVVTALGRDLGRLAFAVDRSRGGSGWRPGRLERHAHHHRLARSRCRPATPPALLDWNSGPLVAQAASRRRSLRRVSAAAPKPGADLDALDRVDAHHRRGEVGIELGVERRAPSGGHALGDAFDDRAQRRTGLARARRASSPTAWRPSASGQKNGLLLDLGAESSDSRSIACGRRSRTTSARIGRLRGMI